MAKLGRYAADRKKVVELTTAATEIRVPACGTVFMLDGTAYSADVTHSLPHPNEAGKGWWCKFIVQTAVLDAGGDDCLIKVRGEGVSTFVDDLIMVKGFETEGAAGGDDADADFITIKGETIGGSQFEFMCDGNKYYLLMFSKDTAAITVDT